MGISDLSKCKHIEIQYGRLRVQEIPVFYTRSADFKISAIIRESICFAMQLSKNELTSFTKYSYDIGSIFANNNFLSSVKVLDSRTKNWINYVKTSWNSHRDQARAFDRAFKGAFRRRLQVLEEKKYLCHSLNHYDVKYLIEGLWLNQN